MALSQKWEKMYKRLVQEHRYDQQQVKILQRQLRQYRTKRDRLRQKIKHESNDMAVWMRMMDKVRREVERVRKQEHRLTPKDKKQLHQILRQLPKDRLEDRLRLMEMSEKVKCKNATVEKAEMGPETSRYTVPSQQQPCYPTTQPAVDKRLNKMSADLRVLRRINRKTVATMDDIRSLRAIIEYLNRGECTDIKITPYVDRRSVSDSRPDNPEDIKATIDLNRTRREKHKNYYTREVMQIQPEYILNHVPQLKADNYNFLQINSKRKH